MRTPLLVLILLCSTLLAACSSSDTTVVTDNTNNGQSSNMGSGSTDDDNDGISNSNDNCPTQFNPMQTASIGNATLLGDLCDDEDFDSIFDAIDNCPLISNPDQNDFDGNTVGDLCEVCGALDANGIELNPNCVVDLFLSDIEYFKDVTLRSEFGNDVNRIRKWRKNVNYYISGVPSLELLLELDRIVAELSTMIDIELIEVDDESDSNFHIFFGSGEDYAANIQAGASEFVDDNWGLFWGYWNADFEMTRATMYVDMFRTLGIDDQKHLLREEFTQALGMWNDTSKYPGSMFHTSYGFTTEYLEIDREVIRTLYNPRVVVGMTDIDIDLLFLDL